MFVITADQIGSRQHEDRVEQILAEVGRFIRARHLSAHVVLPFERTVGDEVQALLADAATTCALALHLQRHQEWSVGIGVGAVTTLATSTRASSGPAFVRARDAVERARLKSVPVPLALTADEEDPVARDGEALLQLLAAIVRRRTPEGWEVVDLLTGGMRTNREVAQTLGISAQAVSQRLRAATWAEQVQVHPLAERLLADLDERAS